MRTRLLPAVLILACCSRRTETADVATSVRRPATSTAADLSAGGVESAIGPLSSAPIRLGDGVVAPSVIKRVDPDYESCKGEKLWGVPIVEAVIDERGELTNARLLKHVHPCLGRVVLDAVRQWKFRPGSLNGKPVAVYYNMTVHINYR